MRRKKKDRRRGWWCAFVFFFFPSFLLVFRSLPSPMAALPVRFCSWSCGTHQTSSRANDLSGERSGMTGDAEASRRDRLHVDIDDASRSFVDDDDDDAIGPLARVCRARRCMAAPCDSLVAAESFSFCTRCGLKRWKEPVFFFCEKREEENRCSCFLREDE